MYSMGSSSAPRFPKSLATTQRGDNIRSCSKAASASGGRLRRSGFAGSDLNVFDGVKFRAQVPKVFGDHPTWGQHQILLQSRIGEWWAASAVGLCRFPPVKAADLARTRPKACLFAEGHQNKTAAAELGISIHTVGFHLRSIYEKLHLHTRSEAVPRALRDGLIH